ncbi:MAG: MerC family mercury resistance protein [Alphaproteobacteria bacterium]
MVAALGYSRDEITAAVKDMYTAVAATPQAHFHFPVGRDGCRVAGYTESLLQEVPEEAVDSFAGVGCPFNAGTPRPGERILDIGSGAGVDSMIAARAVGPSGKVYALDITPAMVEKLRHTAARAGLDNIDAIEGDAERIPLPDASVDAIISNGAINLVPDKRRAAREMFRVLKPGGRMQIADIVIHRPVTPDCLDDPKQWAECVVGATVDDDYLDMFRDAGFEAVEIVRSYDYFAHSPSAETREIAEGFGARAFEIRMRRRAAAPAWITVLARRVHPRRIARSLGRRGLWGLATLILALAACYGTLAAVTLLAAMGTTLMIDEGAWAATIVVLSIAAAAVVTAGIRKHRRIGPTLLAILGAVAVAYSMTVSYDRAIEAAGFLVLAAGVGWDHWIRRYRPVRRSHRPLQRAGLAAEESADSF